MSMAVASELWVAALSGGLHSSRERPYRASVRARYLRVWEMFMDWLATQPGGIYVSVDRIDQDVARAWKQDLQRRASPRGGALSAGTLNRYITVLQKFGTWARSAREMKGVRVAPAYRIGVSRGERRVLKRALRPQEYDAVRAALSPAKWRDVFDFLLETGLRESECLGLRAGEIEWVKTADGAAVPVRLALQETASRELKSAHATRRVPLSQTAREILLRTAKTNAPRTSFIWPRELQRLWALRSAWVRATKKAGVAFRIHDLRHTAAVRWVLAGADIMTVRDRLGHAEVSTTAGYLALVESYRQDLTEAASTPDRKNRTAPILPQTATSGTKARSENRRLSL